MNEQRMNLVEPDHSVSDGPRTKLDDSAGVRRIALVLSELRAGGMERVVVHLASNLHARGVDVKVVCLQEEGSFAEELTSEGVEVVALNSTRSWDFGALYRLGRLLYRFEPDVINVHDYSSLPYVAISGLLRRNCPIVFSAHGLLYNGAESIQRRCRLFSRRLSAFTAVSLPVLDRHVDYLGWQGVTNVISNGVPGIQRSTTNASQVRAELEISDDEFVFLAVGNPRPEKAFEDLIAAASWVQQRDPDRRFSVLIAGMLSDNNYCRSLRRSADEAGVRGLRLLGFRDDVNRLYSAADALVVSSRSEGLPMVVLEAMTAKLPVLSTRVGGIPDAVPDDCGVLVEPRQPQQLGQEMLRLMNLDTDSFKAMGRAANEHALQHFGVSRMTDSYLEVFAKVSATKIAAKL